MTPQGYAPLFYALTRSSYTFQWGSTAVNSQFFYKILDSIQTCLCTVRHRLKIKTLVTTATHFGNNKMKDDLEKLF